MWTPTEVQSIESYDSLGKEGYDRANRCQSVASLQADRQTGGDRAHCPIAAQRVSDSGSHANDRIVRESVQSKKYHADDAQLLQSACWPVVATDEVDQLELYRPLSLQPHQQDEHNQHPQ